MFYILSCFGIENFLRNSSDSGLFSRKEKITEFRRNNSVKLRNFGTEYNATSSMIIWELLVLSSFKKVYGFQIYRYRYIMYRSGGIYDVIQHGLLCLFLFFIIIYFLPIWWIGLVRCTRWSRWLYQCNVFSYHHDQY